MRIDAAAYDDHYLCIEWEYLSFAAAAEENLIRKRRRKHHVSVTS